MYDGGDQQRVENDLAIKEVRPDRTLEDRRVPEADAVEADGRQQRQRRNQRIRLVGLLPEERRAGKHAEGQHQAAQIEPPQHPHWMDHEFSSWKKWPVRGGGTDDCATI